MKTIIKIEIAVLLLALLVGAGLVLVSEGVLELFHDPVIVEPETPPIPTEETIPAEPAPEETVQAEMEEPLTVTATKYFAYDVRQGEYLRRQGDGDEKLYPASITKLLTSFVVLQHMQPADTVTVGDALELVQPDSSLAKLQPGDKLSVEQLIAAMLLPSGNDAAQVAAVAAGRTIAGNSSLSYREAVDVFVEEMNRQAEQLGMTNSHFENPDGFHHDNHYTTMNDLVTLSEKILADPMILKYTCMTQASVELPDRTLEWENTNFLLDSEEAYYLPSAMGLKTGYTGKAGNCLMSAFFQEDRILLIGVFGCPAFTEDRYADTLAIYHSAV